jgi:hypothetical protein
MARLSGPARAFGLTVQVDAAKGDSLFLLPLLQGVVKAAVDEVGNPMTTGHILPILHRITANTMNLVTARSQEAIVERMGRDFTIRNKSHKQRFPSFIQNQVKITKWAYAKDFPDINTEISVTPEPSKTNRAGIPIILSMLEGEGYREPFVGKKRLPIPITENVRQGGVWEGKLQTRFRWDRMGLRYVASVPKREKLKRYKGNAHSSLLGGAGGYKKDKIWARIVGRKGSGIFSIYKNGNLTLLQRDKATGEEKVIYAMHTRAEVRKKMRKLFHFYDEAKLGLYFAQDHFNDLLETNGMLTGEMKSKFKWQRFDFGEKEK